jgi:membrane associated rhomboid family serine protease
MANNFLQRNKQLNPLLILVLLKVVVFVLIFITNIGIDASGANRTVSAMDWFALKGNFTHALKHIWTLFTYSLAEISVFTLIGNLLWLWSFSFVVQDLSGNKHIIPVFIYATLVCGILFITLQLISWPNALGAQQIMIGANVGVIAYASIALRMSPDYRFFTMIGNGIPLWVLAIVFYLLQAVHGYTLGITTLICYIVAALLGLWYYSLLQKGNDISTPLYKFYNWVIQLFEKEKPEQKKGRVYYMQDINRPAIVKKPTINEKRLNAILDKINEHGMQSLTEEEKEFLNKASKQ